MRFSERHAFGGDEQVAVGAVINSLVLCGKQALANAYLLVAALQKSAARKIFPQKNSGADDGNEAQHPPEKIAEQGHLRAVGADGGGGDYTSGQQHAVYQSGGVPAGGGGQGVVSGEVIAGYEAVFGKQMQGVVPPKEGFHIEGGLMGRRGEGGLVGIRKEDAVGGLGGRMEDVDAEVAAAVGVVPEIADVKTALGVGGQVLPVVVEGVRHGQVGEQPAFAVGEEERGFTAAVVVPPEAVGCGDVQAGCFGELCGQAAALLLGKEVHGKEEQRQEEGRAHGGVDFFG